MKRVAVTILVISLVIGLIIASNKVNVRTYEPIGTLYVQSVSTDSAVVEYEGKAYNLQEINVLPDGIVSLDSGKTYAVTEIGTRYPNVIEWVRIGEGSKTEILMLEFAGKM